MSECIDSVCGRNAGMLQDSYWESKRAICISHLTRLCDWPGWRRVPIIDYYFIPRKSSTACLLFLLLGGTICFKITDNQQYYLSDRHADLFLDASFNFSKKCSVLTYCSTILTEDKCLAALT